MARTLAVASTLQNVRYTIAEVLGEGGFGVTYKGNDNRLGRTVAIKELFPFGSNREDEGAVTAPLTYTQGRWGKAVDDFLREARTIAGLDYAGIVAVYDYFEENNTAYMVMKFIDGIPLDRYVWQQGGKLGDEEAVRYTVHVGNALSVLHSLNLLHRDVKPNNIMLTRSGPVLIDFGAAREFLVDRSVQQTAIGTLGFSAPEQFHVFGRKGAYTDVYSLAATTYYMITGSAPTPPLDEAAAASPLMPALAHALAFEPKERPATIAAFLAELTVDMSNAPTIQPQTVGGSQPFNERPSSNPLLPSAAPSQPPTPSVPSLTSIVPPPLTAIVPPSQPPTPSVPSLTAAVPPPLTAIVPPSQPPAQPVAPLLEETTARRSFPMLPLVSGLLLVAVAVILLLVFSNRSSPSLRADPENAGKSSPVVLLADSTLTPADVAVPLTEPSSVGVSLPSTPEADGTQLPEADGTQPPTDTPPATDTSLLPTPTPAPPDTPLVVVPAASNTPYIITATPPPTPPATATPPSLTPKLTLTPKPPTTTPLLPTATPVPPTQLIPNPTTTSATALGANWERLGAADFNAYCANAFGGAQARLDKLQDAGVLDWACYGNPVRVSGVVMKDACIEQYGEGTTANFTNADDASSWNCYQGYNLLGAVPVNEYCTRRTVYGEGRLDPNLTPDVKPAFRWACFAPPEVGRVDGDVACTRLYRRSFAYWLTADDPHSWVCYRHK